MTFTIRGFGSGLVAERNLARERRKPARPPPVSLPDKGQDEQAGPPRSRASEQFRAEVAGLNHAIQNAEQALAMLDEADAGLEAVEKTLGALSDHLRTVVSGENTPEGAHGGAPAQPPWLSGLLARVEAVADHTRFGDRQLLDGSLGATGVAVGDGLSFVAASDRTRTSSPEGYEVRLTHEPVRSTVLGEVSLDAVHIARGVVLSITEEGRTARYVARPDDRPADVVAALNARVRKAGLSVSVSRTRDGRLLVQHRSFGAAHHFQVWSSVPGLLSGVEGHPRLVANGRDIAGTLNGEPASGEGQTLKGHPGNATTAGLVVRYTGLPFTGETHRLPRRRRDGVERDVFVGRVILAQQALVFRLEGGTESTVVIRLDSVRPRDLGRGVDTPSGYLSLADLRATMRAEAEDAVRITGRAEQEIQHARQRLERLARQQLPAIMARLRVKAQNLTAAASQLPVGTAMVAAVRVLSRRIPTEARAALRAQAPPTTATIMWLLREETAPPRTGPD